MNVTPPENKQNKFMLVVSRVLEHLRAHPRRTLAILIVFIALPLVALTPWTRIAEMIVQAPAREFERFRDLFRIITQIAMAVIILIGFLVLRNRSRARDAADGFERETRLSERFTRAVEQLGGTETQIRLGGVYALDRITREAPGEIVPVSGILSAFVRERAGSEDGKRREPGADIQTALTLLTSKAPYAAVALDLRGTVLTGVDLNEALLAEARMENVQLKQANLNAADLRRAALMGANLSGADLRRARLQEARLENADGTEAILTEASLIESRMTDGDWSGARMGAADLTGANLSRSNFSDAALNDANFSKTNLSGAVLSRANLTNAELTESNLTGTLAPDCALSGARLRNAFLFEADLRGAHAGGTDFTEANLTGANLKQANLTGAELQNANLAGANLQQAHLFEANLLHADLTAANLRNVIGLSLKQLFETKTLYRAVLDEEMRLQVEREYPELLREPPAAAGNTTAPESKLLV